MSSIKKQAFRPRIPQGVDIYSTKCPVVYTLECVSGKWKLPILWALAEHHSLRYSALKRHVTGITNMMLNKCLKELEKRSLINRVQYDEVPPRVIYSLTPRSHSLLPALRHLYGWGKDQIELEEHLRPEQQAHSHSGLCKG